MSKIKRLIQQELNKDNERVKTSRKYCNFEERKIAVKEKQEKYDESDEKEEEKKKRYRGV